MNPKNLKIIASTLVILSVLSFAGYFLNRSFNMPGNAIDKVEKIGGKALTAMERLAAAVHTKTIKTEYTSTATRLTGTSRLQVATIDQVELFERKDSSSLVGIPLPDIIVSARAPIEYTYFLDLSGDWNFHWNEKRLTVVAPPIQFNTPAVDASAIDYRVVEGSVFRDQNAAIAALKSSITTESKKRAKTNIHIVRDAARREVERFVQKFIVQAYGVGDYLPVNVVFSDESAAILPPNKM